MKISENSRGTWAVIFDIDGVLADSNNTHFKTWQIAAARHGFDFTFELFLKTFGQTSRSIVENHWDRKLSPEEIHAIDVEKEDLYRELAVQGEVPPIPGALDFVQQLAEKGIPLGVGSSGPKVNVDFILELFQLTSSLSAWVSGTDVVHGKPAPDIYLKTAKLMGVSPERCVVIDDSESGILSGKNAGMKVIGFYSWGHKDYEYEKADLVVRSYDELSIPLMERLILQ